MKKIGYFVVSWIAVSLAVGLGLGRFMGQVRCRERKLLADLRRTRAAHPQSERPELTRAV